MEFTRTWKIPDNYYGKVKSVTLQRGTWTDFLVKDQTYKGYWRGKYIKVSDFDVNGNLLDTQEAKCCESNRYCRHETDPEPSILVLPGAVQGVPVSYYEVTIRR